MKKIWDEVWFRGLAPDHKLLYLYLSNRPGINTLGLFVSTPEEIYKPLGITWTAFNEGISSLVQKNKVRLYDIESQYWFHVIDHIKGFPTKGGRFESGVKQYNKLPRELRLILNSNFKLPLMEIDDSEQIPTAEQVGEYALSHGHLVDGKEFIKFYGDRDWKDSNGKKVRSWKLKVRNVWCRPENKLESVKGAPEGFEYFHINLDGQIIVPKIWRDGLPFGESLAEDKALHKEFKQLEK